VNLQKFQILLAISFLGFTGLSAQIANDCFLEEGCTKGQSPPTYSTDPLAAVVPFGPGEKLTYKVKIGVVNSGTAHMEVLGIDSIREEPSYHLEMSLRGSLLFGAIKVNDHYESWLGTRSISSHRFISDVHQLTYSRYRKFEFYPEKMSWEETESGETGRLASALPLDDISFLYFVRTLPLEVGQTYTLPRYFKREGNPVVIKVEGRKVVKVPAGTFNTIVVRPTVKTRGLFSEGGEAELYLTDDENKHLVYLRSKIPVVGSVTLHLESISEGYEIHTGDQKPKS
jgi:hypothetical protein|tara:strand:+ start:7724 stop:8578 length:855 start_codon:yes stop_codon:yes gene_type:complete